MKILVIDDDPIGLRVVAARLQKDGHTVLIAGEAPEALRMIYKELPDLILCDIMMPYLSGLEVLNIVNIQFDKSIPVILMSGLSNEEVISASINLGAKDYLVKPIQLDDLSFRVNRLVA
jgi:DNA-binding response OmpR family regulator